MKASENRSPFLFTGFAVLTSFGSFLSAIGAFIELGRLFPELSIIAIALAAKTLFSAIVAPRLSRQCQRWGIHQSLLLSQIIGVVILGVEAAAFYSHSKFAILFAIIVSGIPTLFISILSGPILHEYSQHKDQFKRHQGNFQLVFGIGTLIAGLVTPWALDLISIFGVIVLDILSFCAGLIVLFIFRNEFQFASEETRENQNNRDSEPVLLWGEDKLRVVLLTTLCFFATGLIPVFASSGVGSSLGYPRNLVESLWAVESLAGLLVGFVYARIRYLRETTALIVLSGLCLLPTLIVGRVYNPLWLLSGFLVFASFSSYGMMRTRDDFLATAKDLNQRIGFSGFHQVLINTLRTVSPFLIWAFVGISTHQGEVPNLDGMVWIQVALFIIVWPVLLLARRLKAAGFLRVFASSIVGFSLLVMLLGVGLFSTKLREFQNKQVRVWVETFPRSILPHMVESDYIPIEQKMELLKKTGLFESFAVLNTQGRVISAFPNRQSVEGIGLTIKDDTGNAWGEIRYQPDKYIFVRLILAPILILSITLLLMSVLLSKLLQLNARQEEDRTQLKRASALALNQIAVQVSHDIRSPLAALDVALYEVNHLSLSEERRLLIRNAVNRIRDIANQLLEKNRLPDESAGANPKASHSGASVQLLAPLIDSVVTEKRLQYRRQLGLNIEAKLGAAAYGAFVKIDPNAFKTVLSNLISNAVEAISENGKVTVLIEGEPNFIEVKVQDNGKGIPKAILEKLGTRGFSYGKPQGNGLGLAHAKEVMKNSLGTLKIESDSTEDSRSGTLITLRLPRTEPPKWFASRLELVKGEPIIIVDDDTSIHQVWQRCFAELDLIALGIQILRFGSPKELLEWSLKAAPKPTKALYLVDYEFSGSHQTGLDMIEKLGIQKTSVLVTSHFEEANILKRCEQLGVRIIPKGMAAFVPFTLSQNSI